MNIKEKWNNLTKKQKIIIITILIACGIIGIIIDPDSTIKNTPDSQQTKQVEQLSPEEQARLDKLREETLAKMEPGMNKVYYKIDLKQVNKDGNGIYNFYIDPILWVKLPFDKKEEAFKTCVSYVLLKQNLSEDKINMVKISTQIKSAANSATLAEYSAFKGIQVK